MTTTNRYEPDGLNAALAYADMAEAIETGYLATALSLSQEHAVPLAAVWTPDDDDTDDTPR